MSGSAGHEAEGTASKLGRLALRGSAGHEAEGTARKLGSLALMGSAEEEAEGTTRKLGSLALMGSAKEVKAKGAASERRSWMPKEGERRGDGAVGRPARWTSKVPKGNQRGPPP